MLFLEFKLAFQITLYIFFSLFCQNALQEQEKEGSVYFDSLFRVESIMVGRSWQQECKAAGHISLTAS